MVISVLVVFFLRFLSSEGENGSNDCPAGLTGPGCKTTCSQYCVDRKCHLLTSGGTNCTLGCIAGRHGTPRTLECSRNCQHCERYNGDICRHPKSTDDATCSNDCPAGLTGPGCKTTCSQYCVDRKCHLLTSGGTNCTLGCIAGRHGTPRTLECSRNCQHCERYNGDICRHPKSTDDATYTGQGGAVNLRTLAIIIISLVVFAGMCIVVISLLVYRHCRARTALPTDGGKEERRKRFRRKLPPLPPSRCGKGDISSTNTAPHDYCEVKQAHRDTSSTDNQRDHVYDLDFQEQPSEGSTVSLTHIEMKVLVSPQRNTDTQSRTDCDSHRNEGSCFSTEEHRYTKQNGL